MFQSSKQQIQKKSSFFLTVHIDVGCDGIDSLTELGIQIARELRLLLRFGDPVDGLATADVILPFIIAVDTVIIIFAFDLLKFFGEFDGVLLQVGVIGHVFDLREMS